MADTPRLTPSQFTALAELSRAKSYSESYQMARLVLVDGYSYAEAGRDVLGVEHNNPANPAHQAVKRFLHGLELAQTAAGSR